MNFLTQNELKHKVAFAACKKIKRFLKPECAIGIGSGSTVNYFIDALSKCDLSFLGAVPASENTKELLTKNKIKVLDLNLLKSIPIYIDSADEVDDRMCLIKGGGGALTREKIIASASSKFFCIIDYTKKKKHLGYFPLAIEVIPMAKSFVEKRIEQFGGYSSIRENFLTDNGNIILDSFF